MPYAKIPLPAAPEAAVPSSCRTVENRIASNSQKFLYTDIGTALRKGRRFGLLILIIGCQEVLLPDDSSTMRKEALMTDFELLSLVIGIISLVVIVRKK